MSVPRDSESIKRLLQIFSDYGKAGLIIDDAYEAETRAARAIYGSERLPDWWLVVRTLEQGLGVLKFLHDAMSRNSRFPAIVVIDRYLPLSSPAGPDRIAWDLPEDPESAALCAEFYSLATTLNRYRSIHLLFETSYPHNRRGHALRGERGPRPIKWRTRDSEYLYRLRNDLEPELLFYGPKQIALEPLPARTQSGEWLAETWWKTLGSLARDLHAARNAWEEDQGNWQRLSDEKPLVLLTGAGASFKVSSLGRGMPYTSELLREACDQVLSEDQEDEFESRLEESRITPVQALMKEIKSGSKSFEMRLEKIFDRKLNRVEEGGWHGQLLESFRRAFRTALHRYDSGFPYHHWLLARLPWTNILTTNFDGYHERAAASAAAACKTAHERTRVLRLGSQNPDETLDVDKLMTEVSFRRYMEELPPKMKGALLEEEADLIRRVSESTKSMRRHRGLYKPYGSLLLPKPLGLAADELGPAEEYGKNFGACVEEVFGAAKGGWLVVLGQGMVDRSIVTPLLTKLNHPNRSRVNVLWVDPDSLDRVLEIEEADHSLPQFEWDRWMHELYKKKIAGPLPARANEFVYDLWQVFSDEALTNRLSALAK